MITIFNYHTFKEVDLGQKFDIEVYNFTPRSDLIHNTSPNTGTADIGNKFRIKNLRGSIGNLLPINIVRIYFNIDREFQNCFHTLVVKKILNSTIFDPFRSSSGLQHSNRMAQVSETWVKVSNLIHYQTYVNHTR